MKIFKIVLFTGLCTAVLAQAKFDVNRYANFERYRDSNMQLGAPAQHKDRVVFMGNSITQGWQPADPDFFKQNNYINRGISGQVSHQMLLRFRADVIDLKPAVVVILAGTNDIAQNSGPVEISEIAANIFSMSELARFHGIKVVLCAVLPAIDFPWHPGLEPAGKIKKLNTLIKEYAAGNQIPFVDYHSALADQKGGLKIPDYTSAADLVHPNKNGYEVMKKLLQPVLEQALSQKKPNK